MPGSVAADDLWMSPCYEQPCVAIHFTWMKDWEAVEKALPVVEEALSPFDARPHWGKLFYQNERVRASYGDRIDAFDEVRRELDPAGKFSNRLTRAILDPLPNDHIS